MIRVEGVTVRAGTFTLSEVTFEVPAGGYGLLIGPTGSGKTTLLEAIAGHHTPAAGRVWLHGNDVTKLPPERRGVGIVYQDQLLFPHLTVAQNIGYALPTDAADRTSRIYGLAESLGIAGLLARGVERLSGGERQRVALARALAPHPRVLLLDEPFAALDPGTRAGLRRTLIDLQRREGVTILQVSHDFDDALRLGERVAVLAEGRLLQQGTPEEIFRRPNSVYVAEFTGAGNVLAGEVRQRVAGDGGRFLGTFVAGPLTLDVVAERPGTAHAVIRAEDVLVSREPLPAARNHLHAIVERVERIGPVAYIYCDAGLPMVATVTTASADAMALAPGMTVSLTIKSTAIQVV